MFSDGIIDLVHTGVITNAKKTVQTGKIVGSFAFGTKKLYDFMNNNPFVGELLKHLKVSNMLTCELEI